MLRCYKRFIFLGSNNPPRPDDRPTAQLIDYLSLVCSCLSAVGQSNLVVEREAIQ